MSFMVGMRAVILASAACAFPLAGQAGRVTGIVRNEAGSGIGNVEVFADGTNVAARTDSTGRFQLSALPAGSLRLMARRLGYRPYPFAVDVPSSGDVAVEIRLEALAQIVEAVTVTGSRTGADRRLQGFHQRSTSHNGGYFVTRAKIERGNANNVLQLLRGIPAVHILADSRLGRGVRLRGNTCPPLVFIDGFPATAGAYDFESIDPASVEGIEVYSGIGNMPPEFLGPRGLDQCGVIAIWGRQAPDRRGGSQQRQATSGVQAATRAQAMVTASEAYVASAVHTQAMLHTATFNPEYPAAVLPARVIARVQVEFVVDTAGRILWDTYSVVTTTDARFNGSVRDALQLARFSPALRDGRPVPQVVQVASVITPPTRREDPP